MGTAKHRASGRNLAGFALPIIAALLIVASLAATTVLLEHNREAVWKPQSDTKKQLQNVTDSLVKFQRTFHRLPCPAPHDQLPGSGNFGLEGTGCSLGSAINGVERHAIGDGKFMRVGVLPVRTLGLTESYNADEWGNRFTYVVIESLTDPVTFSDETGTLKLISENGTTLSDGAFAIVAHGKDGKGAYSLKSGTVGVACNTNSSGSGSTGDQQLLSSSRSSRNCSYGDNNGEFVMRSSNPQKGVDYFDDQVAVVAMDTQARGTNLPCRPPATPTPFTWADPSDPLATCSAPFTNMASGDTQTITNTSAYNSGNAQVRCNNGSLEVISSTCTHTPACPASTTIWNGTGENCSAARGDLENGESVVLTNTAGGRSGSVRVTCTDGVATPSDISCAGDSCPLPWGGTLAHNGTTSAFSTSSVTCGDSCASETRTCSYGSLSGSYTNQSCTAASCNNCTTPWGDTVAHTSSVTAFSSASVPCGSSCASETRTCTNGVLSGSYSASSCTVQPCAACSLPWGGNIAHGDSIASFENSSVPCSTTCKSQTRSCNNGTLSSGYSNSSCTVAACSCTTPWGANVADGNSVTAYASDSVVCNASGDGCTSETRHCANGVLSGSYTRQDCSVSNCTSGWCWTYIGTSNVLPSVCHNQAPCPSTNMQNTCLNNCNGGAIGAGDCCEETPLQSSSRYYRCLDHGDGTNASCTSPWGTTVLHGDYVSAYSSSSGSCGSTCSAIRESRVCNNGVLSGSYTNQSCSEATSCSASCSLPWGGTLGNGASLTAYSASSVTCGSSCNSVSEIRACNNGVLSGSYTNRTCTATCASCSLPWNTPWTVGGNTCNTQNGTVLSHGEESEVFSDTTLPTTGTAQWRCNNGTATLMSATCGRACTIPANTSWGQYAVNTEPLCHLNAPLTIEDGRNGVGYDTTEPTLGSGEWRCTNGTASLQSSSLCRRTYCALPWGGTIAVGASVTAYSSSSVGCGSTCSSETRLCRADGLSGSYTNQNCSAATCSGVWVVQNGGATQISGDTSNTCPTGFSDGGTCTSLGSTCRARVGVINPSIPLFSWKIYKCETGGSTPSGGTWQYSGGDSCSVSACSNYSAGPPSGSCSNIGESCGIPRSDAWCGDSGVVMQVYVCQP